MILNEETYHVEIDKIAKKIYKEIVDVINPTEEYLVITKFFKQILPKKIVDQMIRHNLDVVIIYKESKKFDVSASCNERNKVGNTHLVIKYFAKNIKEYYLRHEVSHVVDFIIKYPNVKFTKEFDEWFAKDENNETKFDRTVDGFLLNVKKGKYKTAVAKKIAYQKILGHPYHVYGTENIELNQRITEFVHKMQSSSYRSKTKNNALRNDKNIRDYEDLLGMIFFHQYTVEMLKDEELKKYIISRLNREKVLQFINPEVFNRKVAANNTRYSNSGKYDKIIAADTEIKKAKDLAKKNPVNQELKDDLAIYRNKKGITPKTINNTEVVTRMNLDNKIANMKKKSNTEDAMDAYLFSNKHKDAYNELRRYKYKQNKKYSEVTEEVLEEGIAHFKTSTKLNKLSDIISSKLERVEEPEERRKVITLLNKIDRLAKKFEKIEIDYKVEKITKAGNPDAERRFDELTLEFQDIVKLAKREDLKRTLKSIGSYSLLFLAMTIPFKALSMLAPIINPENSNIKKALSYIAMSLPFKFINSDKIVDKAFGGEVTTDALETLKNKDV